MVLSAVFLHELVFLLFLILSLLLTNTIFLVMYLCESVIHCDSHIWIITQSISCFKINIFRVLRNKKKAIKSVHSFQEAHVTEYVQNNTDDYVHNQFKIPETWIHGSNSKLKQGGRWIFGHGMGSHVSTQSITVPVRTWTTLALRDILHNDCPMYFIFIFKLYGKLT